MRKHDRKTLARLYADACRYAVEYSGSDGVFVARVKQFELLAAHGDTEKAALKEIHFVVRAVIEDLLVNDEPLPKLKGKRS